MWIWCLYEDFGCFEVYDGQQCLGLFEEGVCEGFWDVELFQFVYYVVDVVVQEGFVFVVGGMYVGVVVFELYGGVCEGFGEDGGDVVGGVYVGQELVCLVFVYLGFYGVLVCEYLVCYVLVQVGYCGGVVGRYYYVVVFVEGVQKSVVDYGQVLV